MWYFPELIIVTYATDGSMSGRLADYHATEQIS